MIYGLDRSAPPSAQRAAELRAQGYDFFCLYVHGNTPYKWTRADIDMIVAAGFKILPISVAPLNIPDAIKGAQDGADCLIALQNLGLTGTVCLDVENGVVPREYVLAFVAQLNNGGYQVCLYGSTPTLVALGQPQIVDLTWMAYWPAFTNTVPDAPYDWDMWQFMDGAECDLNVARADFPFAVLT